MGADVNVAVGDPAPAPVRLEERADWPSLRGAAAELDPTLPRCWLDAVGRAIPAEWSVDAILVAGVAGAYQRHGERQR